MKLKSHSGASKRFHKTGRQTTYTAFYKLPLHHDADVSLRY